MADSYLLKSQEQTTPFEMSQVESARQQGAAPVQAGIQAYLAMQENARKNTENATMVALEEAKRQDYVAKMQAFHMELDTRMKVGALHEQSLRLDAMKKQLDVDKEEFQFNVQGLNDQPVQDPEGKWFTWMPGKNKQPSKRYLGPDEVKAQNAKTEALRARASHDLALTDEYGRRSSSEITRTKVLKDRSAALYNMRRAGVPQDYIDRVINSWDDEPSTPSDTGFGKMSQAVGDVAAGQVQAPKPSRPSDPAQVIDTLEGPEREQVTSLMNDKELGNPAKVRKYLVDVMNTARESGYSPYAALQIALRSKDLKKLIKERQ